MKAIKHLTDDDLVEVANALARDCSYYVAGWDYSNQSEEEKTWGRRQMAIFDHIRPEMKRRGLKLTVSSLVGL